MTCSDVKPSRSNVPRWPMVHLASSLGVEGGPGTTQLPAGAGGPCPFNQGTPEWQETCQGEEEGPRRTKTHLLSAAGQRGEAGGMVCVNVS